LAGPSHRGASPRSEHRGLFFVGLALQEPVGRGEFEGEMGRVVENLDSPIFS